MATTNELIISGYTSLYELSAAFNFTYAASKQFRDLIKSGFLQDSRKLVEETKETIDELKTKIIIYNESDILNDKKDVIIKELETTYNSVIKKESILIKEIEDTQSNISNKFKPFYIISALFSIFMLFLAGQESYYNTFPKVELFASIMGVIIIMIFTLIDTYINPKKNIAIIYISTLTIIVFAISTFLPNLDIKQSIDFFDKINNKILTDVSIILGVIPFIFAYVRLFFNGFFIFIKSQSELKEERKKVKTIERQLKNLKYSEQFFRFFSKSSKSR